jgi:paraquat-inducible protein B
VYFKNIQVGEVLAVDINPKGQEITIQIFIYEKYLSLLSTKTVFWRHSGVKFEAGLEKGVTVSAGSLSNIISGGISFTSPHLLSEPENFVLQEDTVFPLFEDYYAAVQSTKELQPAGKIIHLTSEKAHSLSVGSPLTHKNIKIGEITSLQLDQDGQSMHIEILVMPRYESIIQSSTRFYDLSGFEFSGDLNGLKMTTKPLTAILAGGVGCINVPHQSAESTTSISRPFPLYKDLNSALQADKLKLTVHLTGAQGLKQGSPVYYRNVKVGDVTALELEDDLRMVQATVEVIPKLRRLFRENTQFWVETTEVNLSGVKNLENIIFGSYLTFLPGDGPPASEFTAQQTPPSIKIAQHQNFTLILEADHLGSLSIGSPIYYREVKIGQVDGYELSADSRKVNIHVSIAHKYAPLIRSSSRFWNISGLKIEGGIFSGVKISTGSFKSFMQGGIAVATPDREQTGNPVVTGHRFKLFDQPQNDWLDWNPDIVLMNEDGPKTSPAAGPKK